MADPLRDVLHRLDGVRENGSGHEALCPAHDDNSPSLSVGTGADGRILLNCHAGCATEDVLDAAGLSFSDLYPEDASSKPSWNPWKDGKQAAVYAYTDESGNTLFEVVRFEVNADHPAHPAKTFRQRVHAPEHPDANHDGYVWSRKKAGVDPVLYRLPKVLRKAEADGVVFVVEGEKDVHALEERGFVATCNPQGAGKWRTAYSEALAGAVVVILPDNDPQGKAHARAVAASCYEHASEVRIVALPGLGYKGDVSDWMETGHTADELKAEVEDAPKYEPSASEPEADAEDDEKEKRDERTQAEVLLDVAAGAELFHTPKGNAYATFAVHHTRRTARVGSSAFADYLRHGFYAERGKSPSSQALNDAKDTLRAQARFDGEKKDVHLRVAGHDGCIYVDLCNDEWQAVKITTDGWEVVSDPPVKFRRVQGMKPLPKPREGGTLDMLRKHVRLSDEGFTLLLGYLVQCLSPTGPYPILELTGEQGSGKSTAAKMVRALVDPSHIPIRTRPRKERDLVVAAENAWALAFDNMSGVKPWLSDALCRLSTGGGFGTRKLYADREEEIFYARRPIILNGINKLAGRSDLADRALRLELEAIPDAERETEADVWSQFERDRPRILGALFDAVSTALENEPSVQLDRLPRMADFARWAVAAESAFPQGEDGLNTNESGDFLHVYEENRAAASESAVEADTVASAIRQMLNDVGMWEGKTTELMEDLTAYLPDPTGDKPEDYPATYQAMGKRLKRIMPTLRAVGIEKVENCGAKGRSFRFQIGGVKEAEEAEEAENPPSDAANADSALRNEKREAEPKRRKRNGSGVEKRPSRPANGYSSATPLPPQRDGPESKNGGFTEGDRVQHSVDGRSLTVTNDRGAVCIVEDTSGDKMSVATADLEPLKTDDQPTDEVPF